MKYWKYIHYSEATQTIAEGQAIKEPFVWSENTPGQDYDDVTTTELLLKKIKSDYKTFEEDGVEYFEKIRADLVLLYKSGSKTAAEIFGIEAKLDETINKIRRGDWMTAQYEISLVTIEAPLDQTLYDEINNYIANYILENY